MHLDLIKDNPFRRPAWRAEHVFAMLKHRPRPLRPRRSDDRYVRAYRWFLKHYLAAGDDAAERQRLRLEMPAVAQAHELFSIDVERRQILEARILTGESFAAIAERVGTDAQTIDYFEQLFFNVRDRLRATDWLSKVIEGPREDRVANRDGVLSAGQRGYVYKLFGFCGGPLVLDTLIACLSPHGKPQCAEDAPEWFAGATRDIVRSRAAMAASVFAIDRDNVMGVLKLALREKAAGSAVPVSNQMSATDHETILRELKRLLGPVVAEAASS